MSDYWKQFEGKSVPLKSLLQWLSDEHSHVTDDEGELLEGWDFPVINSMALERWAKTEAVEDEDDYEYAVRSNTFGEDSCIGEYDWVTLEGAERLLKGKLDHWEWQCAAGYSTDANYTARIVKRRKAGKVEIIA